MLTGLDDPAAAAEKLLATARTVVVKRGAGGAVWCSAGIRVAVPATVTELVDSTGAGDAFAAGLLAAWLDGAEPEAALRAGAALGARAAGQAGPKACLQGLARREPDARRRPARRRCGRIPVLYPAMPTAVVVWGRHAGLRYWSTIRSGLVGGRAGRLGVLAVQPGGELAGLLRRPIVGDQHGHPRQRDHADDAEPDPDQRVRHLQAHDDGGRDQAHHPQPHHHRVLDLPAAKLGLGTRFRLGDHHRRPASASEPAHAASSRCVHPPTMSGGPHPAGARRYRSTGAWRSSPRSRAGRWRRGWR